MSPAATRGDDVVIRRAVPADALALARMRFAFRAAAGDAIEDERNFVQRCARWMAGRLRSARARCWIAELDGGIGGHVWVLPIDKIPNPVDEPEKHAYITNLFVAEPLRGQGIGERLLDAALAWCRQAGVDAVILWPTARSRTLYVRAGFTSSRDLLELRPVAAPQQR